METETSAQIRIRELEERLEAEQMKNARLEKELAKRKEVIEYWESHESHIQYRKDLRKFLTQGETEPGDLQEPAEKLVKEQIWITISYCELYDKWENEQKAHKEWRRTVSQLQEEYGQTTEELERLRARLQYVQNELEEVQEYGLWFEKENKQLWKKLESRQTELARLHGEVAKIPELEGRVAHLTKQLDIMRGGQSPSLGRD